MSLDFAVFISPDNIRSFNELPDNYVAPPLGNRKEIVERLEHLLPEIDFSKGWGDYHDSGTALTIDLISSDKTDTINMFGANIHGGISGLNMLLVISREFKCSIFEFGSSMKIDDLKDAERIFAEWKNYRDQVIRKASGDQE